MAIGQHCIVNTWYSASWKSSHRPIDEGALGNEIKTRVLSAIDTHLASGHFLNIATASSTDKKRELVGVLAKWVFTVG